MSMAHEVAIRQLQAQVDQLSKRLAVVEQRLVQAPGEVPKSVPTLAELVTEPHDVPDAGAVMPRRGSTRRARV